MVPIMRLGSLCSAWNARLLISFFSIIILLGSHAQGTGKTFGEFVYDVPVNNSAVNLKQGMQNWFSFADANSWSRFYNELYYAVINGKLKARPSENTDSILPVELARVRLLRINEMQVEEETGIGTVTYIDSIKPDAGFDIFIRFHENWTFNEKENVLTKTVKGISLGYIVNEDQRYKVMLYVPFANNATNPASTVVLKGMNYSDLRFNEISYDAPFHYFTNAIMKSAMKNPALLRDTLFPFTNPAKLQPQQIRDSVFHSYEFGFYEDWALDITSGSFSKKVHAVVFSNYHPLRGSGKIAAYVFSGFEPFVAYDIKPVLNNVIALSEHYVEDDTIPEKSALAKSFKTVHAVIDSAVRSGRHTVYYDVNLTAALSKEKYTDRMQVQILASMYDSVGNEYIDTIREPVFINGFSFQKDIQLDLVKQQVAVHDKTAGYMTWIDGKEIYTTLFYALADSSCSGTKTKFAENIRSTLYFSNYESPTEQVICGESYEIFNQYFQESSITQRYKFVYSVFQAAKEGKIQLYKPGTDSVMTMKDLMQFNDKAFFPCLGENLLPAWPLAVSRLELIEDFWFCPQTLQWTSVIREISFIQARPADRMEKKLFTLRIRN